MRPGLSEILGAQFAWWQLGFRLRRTIGRLCGQGRAHPDQHVWTVATRWAHQLLAAPWWWRLTKTTLVTGFSVLGVAATAGTLYERLSAAFAVSAAVLVVVPLAVLSAWRHTCLARAILRLTPPLEVKAAKGMPVLRLVSAGLLVSLAATSLVFVVWQEHAAVHGCANRPVEPEAHRWWVARGGRDGVGCPLGGVQRSAQGEWAVRTERGVVLTRAPALGVFTVSADLFDAWQASGGAAGPLGQPIELQSADGASEYVNFSGGHLVRAPGQSPRLVRDQPYLRTLEVGICVGPDRPCLVRASRMGGTIRLGWHWGNADAYNVSWWSAGGFDVIGTEVAGTEFTITGIDPGRAYGIGLQACDKQFLRKSRCTQKAEYIVRP
ncbi:MULTISPECIES: LGFP repeat-containing protein [unclassified Crossiella]|uniref:LGFP repeat-containing protein n=1 Tax=unclassified Crossiella TaxID=2620835 RepID=UPI001FFEE3AC|nr:MULTISPECIES: hypothetical protein [unclassified Crossiella]MCK2241578.1 hypothetical protein [Crossiella sp. S99.2]MCK2255550.1 hypothetical protein [Crossiella sp. S99.1]